MLQRIRFALETSSFDIPVMNSVIECDETYIGGKNKNCHANKKVPNTQGRSTKDKTPVFDLVERNCRVIAMKVPDTTKETLQPIINAHIEKGAKVNTDEWTAYSGLDKRFTHAVVKHGEGIYVVEDSHTNTIEGFWRLLKRGVIGIYHQISTKHLDKYIDEFEFRYNTKKSKQSLKIRSQW